MTKNTIAGYLLALMLVCFVLQSLFGLDLIYFSGACAWLAALFLQARLQGSQRIQVFVLLGAAVAVMVAAVYNGGELSLAQAVGQNQPILAMLAAVSFLRLLDAGSEPDREVPTGSVAFLKTLFGANFMGAAINVTALLVISDRLARNSGFGRLQAVMMGRSFSFAVLYSPFIGGMALSLSLMPDASLAAVAAYGAPMALLSLSLSGLLLRSRHRQEISQFKGYPIRMDSMRFPGLLVITVLFVHTVYPDISVLALISVFAPLLVLLISAVTQGVRSAGHMALNHVQQTLSGMSGELWLFLSAGLFSAGLLSLTQSLGGWQPFEIFDARAASLTLGGILLVSLIGIHPIVCVSFLGPMLSVIDPPHNLVAMVFVLGWAVGCTLSPFSGTNLIIQGRYGINSWNMTRWNLLFAGLIYLLSCAVFQLWQYLQIGKIA